jgi:hypothetical protein
MASLNKRLEAQDRAIEALVKEDKRKFQRKAGYLKEKNQAQETNLEAKCDTLCEVMIDAINHSVVQKHFSKLGQRQTGKEIKEDKRKLQRKAGYLKENNKAQKQIWKQSLTFCVRA